MTRKAPKARYCIIFWFDEEEDVEDFQGDIGRVGESPPAIPFKVQIAGDRIQISADVDLKGLNKLMKFLDAQKPFLEPDDSNGD